MNEKDLKNKIQREELLALHTHYETVIKDELDFFFKYFNFYIGLLSALLAATLAGLISTEVHDKLKWYLIMGPLLIIVLSIIAYKFIRVYYRRFLEALVTVINIKDMLKYTEKCDLASNVKIPIKFPSEGGGGFITQFNRKETKRILLEGQAKRWSAEVLLDKLLKNGDTLKFAKWTLILYAFAALILAVIIIINSI